MLNNRKFTQEKREFIVQPRIDGKNITKEDMKLEQVKNQIDNYFDNITPEELLETSLKYGFTIAKDPLENQNSYITFEEFMQDETKGHIEVCRVIHASRIPKKDKLIYLILQTKNGLRSAVTNLGSDYEPDHFKGQNFGFVMNLLPSKIAKVTSEAMITCDIINDKPILQILNYLPVGTVIKQK